MSDFKFLCPKCGQSILCDTSNSGMNVTCPACQAAITVPKAPEPEPVPAKLGIRQSAPHTAAPPPGTANAPKPTSWGARPAAAPPPKKKPAWIMPVVVSCVVLAVLAIGWFAVGAPMLKKHEDEVKAKQEEAQRQQQAAADAAAAAEAAKIKKAKVVWTLDPAQAEIPETPAAGKLQGVNFTVEKVVFQSGSLTLRMETGSSRQFVVGIPIKPGESIAGKSFEFSPGGTNSSSNLPPAIFLNWKDATGKLPENLKITKDYLLKLEFGEVDNGNVPGGIYLCVPDSSQSYVAGTFMITPRIIPGQKPPTTAPVASKPTHKKKKG